MNVECSIEYDHTVMHGGPRICLRFMGKVVAELNLFDLIFEHYSQICGVMPIEYGELVDFLDRVRDFAERTRRDS